MSQSPHHQPQPQPTMDTDTMLDMYILDYLTKRKLHASRKVFGDEAKVPDNCHLIDAPRGFLFEWWSVFWDVFVSRHKQHQGHTEAFNEGLRVPQQQRQQWQGSQHQSQNVNSGVTGKNTVAEVSNPIRQGVPQQWNAENVGMFMNHLNSTNHQHVERPMQSMDISRMMSSFINQSAQGSPGGPHGTTGVLNSLPLKGWPLTGTDQFLSQIQQQKRALHLPPLSTEGQTEGQNKPLVIRETSQMEGQVQPPIEKKRKQSLMSSSAANTSGTADDKINIDEYLNYGALDGNDNFELSRSGKGADVVTSNDFSFTEIGSVHATSVNCCAISSDGKLVAVGGQDKKARLWYTKSLESKGILDGHSQEITDIRFSPSMQHLATSSYDKTIKIWDLDNPSSIIKTFTGHTASVMSLDFHPKKEDLLCSCDETEIRYWTIKNISCFKVTKGGANLVRFQSGSGKHLAAVVGKTVALFDLENPHARKHILKGHGLNVQSLCWDSSGEQLISVSEDMIKVWRMDLGGKANCIHELSVPEKRFRCGIFHPCYPALLVIGCYQSMELWNMIENKMMMPVEEPISALVVSSHGLIASAGHNDNVLKLWK